MLTQSKLKSLALAVSMLSLSACATLGTKTAKPVEVATPTSVDIPKYEPLVYGAQKPLMCTDPVVAEGVLKNRPNMQVMWENYLYDRPEGIWGEIGGKVEVNGNLPLDKGRWTNACTVRVSHMLNKAGHKIPRQKKNKTVSGANKDQYFYRVADFETYMRDTYGEPDVAITDGSGNSFDLPTTPGLLIMDFPNGGFTGHTTIWNGAGTVDGVNIGGYRVLFWDLPCFIPEDRETTPLASKTVAEIRKEGPTQTPIWAHLP